MAHDPSGPFETEEHVLGSGGPTTSTISVVGPTGQLTKFVSNVVDERILLAVATVAELSAIEIANDRTIIFVEENGLIYVLDKQKAVAGPQEVSAPNGGIWTPVSFAGLQGATGETGPAGAPTGVTGATGETGPAGPAGSQGLPGDDGGTGSTGAQGLIGWIGPTGIQGKTLVQLVLRLVALALREPLEIQVLLVMELLVKLVLLVLLVSPVILADLQGLRVRLVRRALPVPRLEKRVTLVQLV
jgi:hypothetical protein